jgi:hypothetical protein
MTKQEAQKIFDQTCKEVLKTTPLPHWSILKNLKYTDAVVLGLGVDPNMKRDFKYGDNLTSFQEAENIVKDLYKGSYYTTNKGHFIYFDDGRKPVSQMLLNADLKLMPNAVVFTIPRGKHSRLKGNADGKQWSLTFSRRMFIDHSEVPPGGWKMVQFDNPENQNGITFSNLHQLFTAIENGKAKIDPNTPVIITFSDEGIYSLQKTMFDINDFLDKYGVYAGYILESVLPLIGVPVAPGSISSIIKGATDLSGKISRGEKVNAQDIIKASNNLIPENAKPYIQKGINVSYMLENPTPQNLYNASKELGVKKEDVERIVGSVSGKGSAGFIVSSLENGKFDDVMKTLSVLKSKYTTEQAVKIESADQYITRLKNSGGIYKEPIIQNISTLGLSGIPSLVPNIDKIAGGLLSSSWSLLGNTEKRAWLNIATFRPDLETKTPDLAIEVMKQQARDSALIGAPYVIPAEVPNSLKNCIALKITADTGVAVATTSVKKQEVPAPVTPRKPITKKAKRKRIAFI